MFFPLLLSRYKRIEIIIKIKANFYKEIAQFTILVAIIGNKISKYFFLTSLSQILYISTRQTYTGGKCNSRDSKTTHQDTGTKVNIPRGLTNLIKPEIK